MILPPLSTKIPGGSLTRPWTLPSRELIVPTLLTVGAMGAGATTSTTASISPAPGSLVAINIVNAPVGTTATPVTSVTGAGITWVRQGGADPFTGAGDNPAKSHSVWVGIAPLTPAPGVLTISYGGITQQRAGWVVTQFVGTASVLQAKVATSVGTVTSISGTFDGALEHPSNGTYMALGWSSSLTVFTATAGFATLGSTVTAGVPMAVAQFYKRGSASGGVSWSGALRASLVLLELQAAEL
jgi:hypothetical protein